MRSATVQLDTIRCSLRHAPSTLRLASELSVALPDAWEGEPSAEEISLKVSSGLLWVERGSPCRLSISVAFTGQLAPLAAAADGSNYERHIIETIRRCSAWETLGLRLSRCQIRQPPDPDPSITATFSIGHLPPGSGHLASPYPTRAQLRNLTCSFEFDRAGPQAKPPTPMQTPSKVVITQARPVNPEFTRITRSMTRSAASPDSLASQPALPDVDMAEHDQPHSTQDMPASRGDDLGLDLLIGASVHTLLGLRKRISGVLFLSPSIFPSLLDIAPGVWNTRYLQSIVSRAPFLHHISSVLSRLERDGLDPALRHKVKLVGQPVLQLQCHGRENEKEVSDLLDLSDQIGNGVWPILQRGVSFTALPRRGTTVPWEAQDEEGMDQEEEDNFLSPLQLGQDLEWGLEDDEMMLAYDQLEPPLVYPEGRSPKESEEPDGYFGPMDGESDETSNYEVEEMMMAENPHDDRPPLLFDDNFDDDEPAEYVLAGEDPYHNQEYNGSLDRRAALYPFHFGNFEQFWRPRVGSEGVEIHEIMG